MWNRPISLSDRVGYLNFPHSHEQFAQNGNRKELIVLILKWEPVYVQECLWDTLNT